MKTYYSITLCLLLAGTACSSIQEEPVNTDRPQGKAEEVFYATLEQGGLADATKVYADEDLKVLWNANDRISIFNRYTYGYEYAFQGLTGDTAGAFVKEDDDVEFVTGNPLDKIYAVYPYREDNKISNSGELSVLWPSIQTYKPDSFGIGSNVMVSVTTNNQLRFRNVGGYLALKLYGDNVSVSSITLRGNNGEKLSGRATVTCASEAEPTLTFQSASSESLRLECTSSVPIGSTAETATTFWLVVPPTEFTQGFNITVRTSNGLVFVKSTDNAYEIERNTLHRMAAIEVIPSDIIPFADANFKAYCVANFDTDNDGEISLTEALAVNVINVNTDNIESIQAVEFFENLKRLSCYGSWNDGSYNGILSSLDVTNNTALTGLECFGNQLTSLDVSHNVELTGLHCGGNHLTSLDVSNNTALTSLDCDNNQLAFLDVTNNTSLTYLQCGGNQLTSLDVSHNVELTGLYCGGNHLTSLDVSNNTALTSLECYTNQLTSLDVSNNTALTSLGCSNNQLTSLDVSNNTALIELWFWSNQLTDLDVGNNTALTYLSCAINQLTALDVNNNTALEYLDCHDNHLIAIDVSNNIALTELSCTYNQLTILDVSSNTALTGLWCDNNQLTFLDVSNNTALTRLACSFNLLPTLDVSNNSALTNLWCYNNPYLTDIWLKTGQNIPTFDYDTNVAQIQYKD